MGNTSSAPPAREQNRLSKPRTSSTASLLTSQSTSSFHTEAVNARFSGLRESRLRASESSSSLVTPAGRDDRSRREVRQHLRSVVIEPIDEDVHDAESEGGGTAGQPATRGASQRHSLSRTGSMVSRDASVKGSATALNRSRLSLVPDSRALDVDSAIAILGELKESASQQELVALRTSAPHATYTSLLKCAMTDPALGKTLSQDNDANAEIESHTLDSEAKKVIRRRSLAVVPGMATRVEESRSVQRKPVRPLPVTWESVQRARFLSAGQAPLSPAPLAQLALPEFSGPEAGRPSSRAATPAGIEYSQLGALKLGSLVVTNGAASPEPKMPSATGTDYFTAKEVQITRGSNIRPVRVMNGQAALTTDARSSGNDRSIPAREFVQEAELASDPRTVKNNSGLSGRAPTGTTEEFYGVSHQGAFHAATDYIAELPASPFPIELPAGPDRTDPVRTTGANNNRVDSCVDEGYDSSPTDEKDAFREAALRILQGSIFDGDRQESKWDGLQTPRSLPDDAPNEPTRPRKTKADSGYSSEASLGGIGGKRDPRSRKSEASSRSLRSFTLRRNSTFAATQTPNFSDQIKSVPYSETKEQPAKTPGLAKSKSARFLRLRSKSWLNLRGSDTPDTPKPEMNASRERSGTTEGTTSGPRRLQKPQPSGSRLVVSSATGPASPSEGILHNTVDRTNESARAQKQTRQVDTQRRPALSSSYSSGTLGSAAESSESKPTSERRQNLPRAALSQSDGLQSDKDRRIHERGPSVKPVVKDEEQARERHSYDAISAQLPPKRTAPQIRSREPTRLPLTRPKSTIIMPSAAPSQPSNPERSGRQQHGRRSLSRERNSLESDREGDEGRSKMRANRRSFHSDAPPVPPLPPGAQARAIGVSSSCQATTGHAHSQTTGSSRRTRDATIAAAAAVGANVHHQHGRAPASMPRYYAKPVQEPEVMPVRTHRSPIQRGTVAA